MNLCLDSANSFDCSFHSCVVFFEATSVGTRGIMLLFLSLLFAVLRSFCSFVLNPRKETW